MKKFIALAAFAAFVMSAGAQAKDMMPTDAAANTAKEKTMDMGKEKAMEAGKDMAKDKAMDSMNPAAGEAAANMKDMKKEGGDMMAKDTAGKPEKTYMEVTAMDVKKMMDDKAEYVLLDARDEKSYKAGHIDGAKNMRPDMMTKENMMKMAKNMDAKIIFYCGGTTCDASEKAAKKAQDLGYKNVYRFTGGMTAWKESGYTVKM